MKFQQIEVGAVSRVSLTIVVEREDVFVGLGNTADTVTPATVTGVSVDIPVHGSEQKLTNARSCTRRYNHCIY